MKITHRGVTRCASPWSLTKQKNVHPPHSLYYVTITQGGDRCSATTAKIKNFRRRKGIIQKAANLIYILRLPLHPTIFYKNKKWSIEKQRQHIGFISMLIMFDTTCWISLIYLSLIGGPWKYKKYLQVPHWWSMRRKKISHYSKKSTKFQGTQPLKNVTRKGGKKNIYMTVHTKGEKAIKVQKKNRHNDLPLSKKWY